MSSVLVVRDVGHFPASKRTRYDSAREGNVRLYVMPFMGTALGLLFASSAFAADAPVRKPGLWEVKTAIEGQGRPVTVQQCIDAATDQMLQPRAGPLPAPLCTSRSE